MMQSTADRKFIVRILLPLLILLSMRPYWVWGMVRATNVAVVACVLAVVILLARDLAFSKRNMIGALAFVTLMLFFARPGPRGIAAIALVPLAMGILMVGLRGDWRGQALDGFATIFTLLLIPGLVVYFLIFVGVDLPYSVYLPDSGAKHELGQFYRVYWGAVFLDNLIFPLGGFHIARFSAFLDEPGYLGTIIALLLAAREWSGKGSWRRYILVIAGICSFSLAFYILSLVGLVVRGLALRDKRRLISTLTVILVAGSLLGGLVLSTPIGARILAIYNGKIEFDNRTDRAFEIMYQRMVESGGSRLLWGYGNAAHTKLGGSSSSLKDLVYNQGLLGVAFLLAVLFLIVLCELDSSRAYLHGKRSGAFVFLLLFAMSLYQRPDVYSPIYLVTLLGGIDRGMRFRPIRGEPPARKSRSSGQVDGPQQEDGGSGATGTRISEVSAES